MLHTCETLIAGYWSCEKRKATAPICSYHFFSLRLYSIDHVVTRQSHFSVPKNMLFLLASAEKNVKTLKCEPKTKESKCKHTEFKVVGFNFFNYVL